MTERDHSPARPIAKLTTEEKCQVLVMAQQRLIESLEQQVIDVNAKLAEYERLTFGRPEKCTGCDKYFLQQFPNVTSCPACRTRWQLQARNDLDDPD